MSSGEKLPKGKSKKLSAPPKPKSAKGKEVLLSENRFRGDGVKFKCKLIGSVDVSGPRGDTMCAEGIKKLKAQAKQLNKEIGEHKQKINLFITIKGIRIVDEKTQIVQHEQPINKISFITHDPEDKKIFGYVCSQACTTGHKLFAIKSEKAAGVVTGTLYELFQVVFKLRKEAGLKKKAPDPPQVSNGPSQQSSDGIYEVPFKNGNGKPAQPSPQVDHEYAEPVPASSRGPHYKVPPSAIPVPSPDTGDSNRADVKFDESSTEMPASTGQQVMDKEPGQEATASGESVVQPQDSSSRDLAFFSPSVFESTQNESATADTASLASADVNVFRSGSVSSGSSEAYSVDARSVDSRSGSLNQPSGQEALSPVSESGGSFQAVFAAFEETAAGSSSFVPEAPNNESVKTVGDANTGNFSVSFPPPPSNTSDVSTSVGMGHNLFAPLENAPLENAPEKDQNTQSVATEKPFINNDSFAAFDTAFGDVQAKSNVEDNRENSLSTDPFGPSAGPQEKDVTQTAEGFEADFGSVQFPPVALNSDLNEEQTLESSEDLKNKEEQTQSTEVVASPFVWDNTFGGEESTSQVEQEQHQVVSDKQFSWREAFTSDATTDSKKTDFVASASFSWDEAFGADTSPSKESTSTSQEQGAFSWDDAFGGKATEGSEVEFDSSPFADAFAPAPAQKPHSSLPSVSETSASQESKSTGDSFFNGAAFTASAIPTAFPGIVTLAPQQLPEGTTDTSVSERDTDTPVSSKDPFDDFSVSFPTSAAEFEKKTSEHSDQSSESSNGSSGDPSSDVTPEFQVDFSKVSSVLSEENPEKIPDVEELEKGKELTDEELDDERTEQVSEERPSQLPIQESKLLSLERPVSPSAPPPLPPRPIFSPPPLPARPRSTSSSNSTVSAGMSPISPLVSTESPTLNSPLQTKKGGAKKPPPAPPPRVDLNEKAKERSQMGATQGDFSPGLFGGVLDSTRTTSEHEESSWAAAWPSSDANKPPEVPNKEKSKDLSDPFSEDFFTNFDFPQEATGSPAVTRGANPFASTPAANPFAKSFGDQDLFASFPASNSGRSLDETDPFSGGMSDSFAAFPSKDPFSDITDPFADRGVLSDDPFGDSPRKLPAGESLTLNESLVASDEADSFA